MRPCQKLLFAILLLFSLKSYSQQQDVEFHLSAQLLQGKTVLKVNRDFYDPYVWVLVKNNEVYRVNSLTLAVDNFTSLFAAYSNFQFIDIAGRSKDTVFVATNSPNVVEYKSGAFRVIGAGDGVPDTVNSIGMSQYITYQFPRQPPSLMIGTAKGLRLYDIVGEKIADKTDYGDSRIYEATYRTELYKDSSDQTSDFITGDTVDYQPVTYRPLSTGSVYNGFLWEGGKEFGYNIHTALSVYESIDTYNALFTNLFWGNNRGMFQNYFNTSYLASNIPGGHYLDGINVNKITSIYGLSSFGSGEPNDMGFLIKQNLLVGTDKGFYFSSSIYTSGQSNLRKFSLFHFDELGNTRVNDVCVNATVLTNPICEDGVWLACDNGLYLLRPDYAKYLNNQPFQAASFKGTAQGTSSVKICAGNAITAMINTSEFRGNSYQWYKDGQELPGKSQSTLSIKTSGEYYAVLYDPCENVHLESNHLTVQVISAPVFTFNYPNKLQYCDSTSTTLKVDNNPGYHYRWYTNGVLNGDTTFNFTVTQSGKYKVELSACTNSWVPSKEIEVDLINLPFPVVTADKVTYCGGETATLYSGVTSDPAYTINWYKDGNPIPSVKDKTNIAITANGNYTVSVNSIVGNCMKMSDVRQVAFTPAPIFTFVYPDKQTYCDGAQVTLKAVGSTAYQYRWYKNGELSGDMASSIQVTQPGTYSVEVSSCEGSWVPSKETTVNFIKIPVPNLQADKNAYCIGDNATLTIPVPPDPAYTINWYKDNTLLSSNTNQTSLTTNQSGNYSVSITSNTANTDGTVCTQNSVNQSIGFKPLPTVSIQKIIKTTLCDGQTVDLKVTYDNGTVKWNTGESSDKVTVSTSGNYKATVTNATGCIAEANIDVQFFPNPVLNLTNTGVCVPSHKTVTLTAPPGMVSYTWNGQAGSQTYIVDHPQTVTLTVTDNNGCQATQDIQVVDECPNIVIPNAFTPNGDGINDTWNIPGLEYDPTSLIRVFTRYGQEVFESRGYQKPWDGTNKGKQLPAGVYYYIITTNDGTQTFSGSVTILY